MSYMLEVGTDLFGTKHNTLLAFGSRPSVKELIAAVESYFDTKSRAVRPAGYPDTAFRVESFQFFDEEGMRWRDLEHVEQLRPGQQLWSFQPESVWHSDAQGIIPRHDDNPVTWTTPTGSPRRARVPQDAGVPPTLAEKLRFVYSQVDRSSKGYILREDLQDAFARCDMEFNNASAGALFQMADTDRNQHISFDEFVEFAMRCTNIVDGLFFRLRDISTASARSPGWQSPVKAPPPVPAARPPPPQSYAQPPPQSYSPPPAASYRAAVRPPPPVPAPEPQPARSAPSGPPPPVLTVSNSAYECDGDYHLTHEQFAGMPVWERQGHGPPRLLYSSHAGHWMVSDDRANFDAGCGWLTTARPHHGQMPHCCHGEWENKAREGRDERITVAMKVTHVTQAPAPVATPQTTTYVWGAQPATTTRRVHYVRTTEYEEPPPPQPVVRAAPPPSVRVETASTVTITCKCVTEDGVTTYTITDAAGDHVYAGMHEMPSIHRAVAEEAVRSPQSVRTLYSIHAGDRKQVFSNVDDLPPESRKAAQAAASAAPYFSHRAHATTA